LEQALAEARRQVAILKPGLLEGAVLASIRPRFEQLRPGYCEVSIRKRHAVLNHIGTVHAIAMCNMAELSGGTMTDVTIPATHRWIPKGMTVEYLKKATTDLAAVATFESEANWLASGEYRVNVDISEKGGPLVFRAKITMWVTARASSTAVLP